MKIAITADLHLTERVQNPERFETFENLLTALRADGVNTLIIAGDLFDETKQNYADFEQICRRDENQEISIIAIPGNHDPSIDNRKIVADRLKIITTTTLLDNEELGGLPFLFVPYESGASMGEKIAAFGDQLPPSQWVLIGHGDWAGGIRVPNVIEPGVYMPLTRADLDLYKPARAFLGHIHSPSNTPLVCSVGSPLGLDINETGRRRFLLYDTETDQVDSQILETPILYFNETFIIVPVEDEAAYLRKQIRSRIANWELTSEEYAKTQIRVKVAGYSANKSALPSLLQEEFAGFMFFKGQEPDISDVSSSEDQDREFIAEQVKSRVDDLEWSVGIDQPSSDEILLEALHIIYKR